MNSKCFVIVSFGFSLIAALPTPVAYWDFEEGSGTQVLDKSGHNHNGTINGSAVWAANGVKGKALYFDGTTTRVTVPFDSSLNLNSFTLSVWVNTVDPSVNQTFISRQPTAGMPYNYRLENYNGFPDIDFWPPNLTNPPSNLFSSAALSNSWHLVTGTFSQTNGTMKIYMDGQLRGQKSLTIFPYTSGSEPLVIGGSRYYTSSFQMKGWLDEIRVYSVALSDSQADSLYSATKPVVALNGRIAASFSGPILKRNGRNTFVLSDLGNALANVDAFDLEGQIVGSWRGVGEGRSFALASNAVSKSGLLFLRVQESKRRNWIRMAAPLLN